MLNPTLYLTGALSFEAQQLSPSASLGGYISSSEVQENILGNLFDGLSQYTVNSNRPEIRVLALKNTTSASLVNLKAYFEYPDSADSTLGDSNQCYFKIGYATPLLDSCADLYITKITSPNGVPFNTTLSEADGLENSISLPDLSVNEYIIIYIQRLLDPVTQTPLTNEELLDILNGVTVLETSETTSLNFYWD